MAPNRTWDLFCRVVDNHGDIGVCWRLAADLGERGVAVRLRVDEPSALGWMAPAGARGVTVLADADAAEADDAPGDVVIEAFGCDLPQAFVRRMAAAREPPLWINLEYLSAEAYVERSHGLPSPQLSGPGVGLEKWFFFPGFTPRTGGLIREAGLSGRQRRFDSGRWLAAHGFAPHPPAPGREGEIIVSLFCYAQPALDSLLEQLSQRPTRLLATPGHATRQVLARTESARSHTALQVQTLPWLTQIDYDHLLWASDLNFVRGEDTFVRAQWAGKPFVWQAYPQADGTHAVKLAAFLDRFLEDADPVLAAGVRAMYATWNGLASGASRLPELAPWRAHCLRWREKLLAQPDLATRLLRFVAAKR